MTLASSRPAWRISAGRLSRSSRRSSIAWLPNGSESRITQRARGGAVVRGHDARPLPDGVLARPGRPGDARLLLDQVLQRRQFGLAPAEIRRLDEQLGRRDHTWHEPLRGGRGGLPRLGVGRQAAHQREAELGLAQLGRRVHEAGGAGDGHDPGQHPRARCPVQPARRGDGRRLASLRAGTAPRNARPPAIASSAGTRVREIATPMPAVSARPGPSARKKPSVPTASVAVPAITIRPATSTIGVMWAVAWRGGLEAVASIAELAPELRHEEDRIVGDDPEQQHEDEWLELAGDGHVGLLAAPGDDADGDGVGQAGGEQRHQRREQRAHRQADHAGDQHHGRELDPGQSLLDRVFLLHPCGDHARQADQVIVGIRDVARGEVVTDAVAVADARGRVEVEIRDDRGAVLARERQQRLLVDDRRRQGEALHLRETSGRVGGAPRCALDGARQSPSGARWTTALSVSSRVAEELVGALLRGDGLGVLGYQALRARVARAADRRQVDRGRHGRGDPGQHDRPAQARPRGARRPAPHAVGRRRGAARPSRSRGSAPARGRRGEGQQTGRREAEQHLAVGLVRERAERSVEADRLVGVVLPRRLDEEDADQPEDDAAGEQAGRADGGRERLLGAAHRALVELLRKLCESPR